LLGKWYDDATHADTQHFHVITANGPEEDVNVWVKGKSSPW
jgi:hypothetical protein